MKDLADHRTCQRCGRSFRSARKRRWCGKKCYELSRRPKELSDHDKALAAYRSSPLSAYQKSADAAAAQELGNASWLHERIAEWYIEQNAERLSRGVRQPIPLTKVLQAHDCGEAVFAPSRLVKIAASLEDAPGPASESEDEE